MIRQYNSSGFVLKSNAMAQKVPGHYHLVAGAHCYPPAVRGYKPSVLTVRLPSLPHQHLAAPATKALPVSKHIGPHGSNIAAIAFNQPMRTASIRVGVLSNNQFAESLSSNIADDCPVFGEQRCPVVIAPHPARTTTTGAMPRNQASPIHRNSVAAIASTIPVKSAPLPGMRKRGDGQATKHPSRQIHSAPTGANNNRPVTAFSLNKATTTLSPAQQNTLCDDHLLATRAQAAPVLRIVLAAPREADDNKFSEAPSHQIHSIPKFILVQLATHYLSPKENAAARACVICQDNTACGRRNTQYSTGACCLGRSIIARMERRRKGVQLVYRP